MTNGGSPSNLDNPVAYVSPGNIDVIQDVLDAHGGRSGPPAPEGSYMDSLDEYFAELGQKRTADLTYEPSSVRGKNDQDDVTRPGSPTAVSMEFSVLCQLQRQLYRAMKDAEANAEISRKNTLQEKLRAIEAKLGYPDLESDGVFLAELLYVDPTYDQFDKSNVGDNPQVEEDVLVFREGLKEKEETLAARSAALTEKLFATRDMSGRAVNKAKAKIKKKKNKSPENFLPEHEITAVLGLYPFERQVDIIDRFTACLEKHASGSAILLEMLRTGVPFDPLALFSVGVNKGQRDELVFNAPDALVKKDGNWSFESWESAGDEGEPWLKEGQIIKDPVGSDERSPESNAFVHLSEERTAGGAQHIYRIRSTTDLGAKLARIAARFAATVTSALRGYQEKQQLDSSEKKRVQEFQGYLAVISRSFIKPDTINSRLRTDDIEDLAMMIPDSAAGQSGTAGPPRSARGSFKQKHPGASSPRQFEDALSVVSQLQSHMGSIVEEQFSSVKAAIRQDYNQGNIDTPGSQSINQYIANNPGWRRHNSELIRWQRRFTYINLLCSSLELGFSVVDHARYASQDYNSTEMVKEAVEVYTTFGSMAADIDTILANNISNYDTHIFVQKGLAEAGGYVADTVDVVLTIDETSTSAYNSMSIGNPYQAIETTTTAMISIGSIAAGYAIGNLPGAVIAAVLDVLATFVIDALSEDVSSLEAWAGRTLFGTKFDEIQESWDPFGIATPAANTPAVQFETDSDSGEGLTYFKWHKSITRQIVGYYNLTMGFDVAAFSYGGAGTGQNPDPQMQLILDGIAFGREDGKVVLSPIRKLSETEYVVDAPYMSIPLASGSHSVTVNEAGLYGMPTESVTIDCYTNGSVPNNQSTKLTSPSGKWVDDVWAFQATYTGSSGDRPVVWPPKDAGDKDGNLWGFEVIHMMGSLPSQVSSSLSQRFSFSKAEARKVVENVPHPRGWEQPGLDQYPPSGPPDLDLGGAL